MTLWLAQNVGTLKGSMTLDDVREVGDGEKGVLVEDVAVKEPLEEVPRHWIRRWSRSSLLLGCFCRRWTGRTGRTSRRARGKTDARQSIESGRARGRSDGDTSRERGLLHIDST